MKIELKNIRHIPILSMECEAFTASLFIKGVRAGVAHNNGMDPETLIDPKGKLGNELVCEAELYCKALPPEKSDIFGNVYFDMDLPRFINNLVKDHVSGNRLKRFNKKVQSAMEMHIVVGIPGEQLRTLGLKFPIGMILVSPRGNDVLSDILAKRVIPNLGPGEQILNTNIPIEIFKNAGLNEDQYVRQEQKLNLSKKRSKTRIKGL